MEKIIFDLQKGKELYEQGFTQAEVGKRLGVTQRVVHNRFKEAGIKCRTPKNLKQTGEDNPAWKGDNAKYAAYHYRVQKLRGKPEVCSMCETTKAKRFEWANVTGDYANVYDYVRLCKSCHSKFDNVITNIIGKSL